MADTLSKSERSARMALVRDRDSTAELIVRRTLHRLGYRYRLHRRDLPGRPDIVFGKRRKVIFVHGCFWHRHPDSNCRLARLPKSKLDFWLPKLMANAERDKTNEMALRDMGWEFLVVWECELGDSEHLENKLLTFVESGTA